MAHFATTAASPAAVSDAFAFIADFNHLADWDPGVGRSVRLDDGDLGVGSRFHVDSVLGPVTIPLVYEVVEYDAPHRVVLQASTASFTSYDVITVEAEGEGSSMTYDATLTLHGVRRIFDPFLSLAFQVIGGRAAAGLARAAGALSPAQPAEQVQP